MEDADAANNTTWREKLKLKELVSRAVEEICNPKNMEEFKHNFGVLILEALKRLIRNEGALDQSAIQRETTEV